MNPLNDFINSLFIIKTILEVINGNTVFPKRFQDLPTDKELDKISYGIQTQAFPCEEINELEYIDILRLTTQRNWEGSSEFTIGNGVELQLIPNFS